MDGEGRWNYGWKRLDGVGKDRGKKGRRGDGGVFGWRDEGG